MKLILLLLLQIPLLLAAVDIYVVNSGSGTLSHIDTETGITDNAFAGLGSMANRMALTQEKIYVVNSGDNTVQIIDRVSGNTLNYVYLESSANPYDIVISGDHAYVSGTLRNKVYKLDLAGEVIISQALVGGNPQGLAVSGGKLYVGNTDYASGYQNCSVSVLALDSFELLTTIPVEDNPQFLLAAGDHVHVSCTGDWSGPLGKVCIIDTLTDEVVEVLDIGGYPGGLALAGNQTIYLGDSMNSGIYAYDAFTWEIFHDASNPFLPGGSAVAGSADHLAVLGGNWGENFSLYLYDSQLIQLATYTAGLYGTDVKLYTSDNSSGSGQMELSQTIVCRNFPNPFFPASRRGSDYTRISFSWQNDTCPQPDVPASISIYNIKGQLIRKLAATTRGNTGETLWDGRNELGKTVEPGVYIYQLSLGGYSIFKKLTCLE
ncbi:MAG: hypothetical protein JW784_05135 [Candidatus Cloacimonetes bacterium]|nr:hypothetical protein [Candidatus Cloacimonadota bacterium]